MRHLSKRARGSVLRVETPAPGREGRQQEAQATSRRITDATARFDNSPSHVAERASGRSLPGAPTSLLVPRNTPETGQSTTLVRVMEVTRVSDREATPRPENQSAGATASQSPVVEVGTQSPECPDCGYDEGNCRCDEEFPEDYDCTICGGDGTCMDNANPLWDCDENPHACHACAGTGRRSNQRFF